MHNTHNKTRRIPIIAFALASTMATGVPVAASQTGCDAEPNCHDALLAANESVTPDPWQRFHNGLGARFDADPASSDTHAVIDARETPDAAPAETPAPRRNDQARSRGLLLFWLLRRGDPNGQR